MQFIHDSISNIEDPQRQKLNVNLILLFKKHRFQQILYQNQADMLSALVKIHDKKLQIIF